MSVRAESDETPLTVSFLWSSLAVALMALTGSIWLSVGMNLKACPLCLYQRTFVMGVVGVLGIGILTATRYRGVLNLLALPTAVGGFGVAVFHEYLELVGKLECPAGVLGVGSAPQQSLLILTVLLVLVMVGALQSRNAGESNRPAAAAVVLGVLLAGGAIISAPPMPLAPTKAYETPLEVCRPPYRP